jgi:hypothetical protein
MPPSRRTSYRHWQDFSAEGLRAVRATLNRVIEDQERQGDLFAPASAAPALFPIAPAAAAANPLGAILSPSQVKSFLDCSARWWFKYGAGLADPRNGALVRGTVVHKMAEGYFRAKLRGDLWEPELMGDFFEATWNEEARAPRSARTRTRKS